MDRAPLALSRPRMVAVLAILILILGALSSTRMPKDIFPPINIPVVSVVWSFPGLSPVEMEGRVLRVTENAISTTVNDIEHVESQALSGVGVTKVYFQPGATISQAVAQVTAVCQTILRTMPPGITPPLILQYDASNVPIIQLAVSSDRFPINQIFDAALYTARQQLVPVRGASISLPFGGAASQIMVDLDPEAMTAHGVTAQNVATALANQNLIIPAGDAKIGTIDYVVRLNSSPIVATDLNDIPVSVVNGAIVYLRDVAHVRQGPVVQSNMVRVAGKPAVLLTVFKSGSASTLDVINQVKARLPQIRAILPDGMKVDLLLDQSVFVRGALDGVMREGAIAACLTALMILLFLGSWRSTLVVAVSIPLSILTSIVLLSLLGHTLNTLTLLGLALAVGMLVDDATVEVENTTRNLGLGLPLRQAILQSAQQVALPALASTLSICIVFVPVAFLTGVAQSLFVPLALAVVFAMIASYLLSRTLVTTMMQALLGKELHLYQPAVAMRDAGCAMRDGADSGSPSRIAHRASRIGPIWWVHEKFERRFERLREGYHGALAWALGHRALTTGALLLFFAGSALLPPLVGQDFFPAVDAGQMRLHVRAPVGTRLEETARLFSDVEGTVRQVIPSRELALILDNLGQPGGINVVWSNSGTIAAFDGEIDISLTPKHRSTWDYVSKLRQTLSRAYPQCTFYFQPADITTQVLNFGLPSAIDVQVGGPYPNQAANYALAKRIRDQIAKVPGVVDCYLYQVRDEPQLMVNVDRTRAIQMGLTQQQVAGNVLVSLASSTLVSPSFWLNTQNGVQYPVTVQTPQYRVSSLEQLMGTPVGGAGSPTSPSTSQLLANVATVARGTTPAVINHMNVLPVFDVYASVENRDLGGAAADIQRILNGVKKETPRGSTVTMAGQVRTMQTAFAEMGFGLIFAIVLVYLLLTVNFESWVDPLVILMATPGALSGVVWMLYVTQTTFNVPSLMGAIMSIGVVTANSILLVTFANEQREEGKSAMQAALAAGTTRFRPVIMTALAMILGMLPMALGLGDGGEQNAPLGRAVIGGLCVATCTTLFFVPLMYTVLRRKQPVPAAKNEADEVSPAPAADGSGRGDNPV